MSYGERLSCGECRIAVGQVHTNGLGERFEEHRRITALEGEELQFVVVLGKRAGNAGSCQVRSFWIWSRGEVK